MTNKKAVLAQGTCLPPGNAPFLYWTGPTFPLNKHNYPSRAKLCQRLANLSPVPSLPMLTILLSSSQLIIFFMYLTLYSSCSAATDIQRIGLVLFYTSFLLSTNHIKKTNQHWIDSTNKYCLMCLLPLCFKPPLLPTNSMSHMLRWATCSLITMNTHSSFNSVSLTYEHMGHGSRKVLNDRITYLFILVSLTINKNRIMLALSFKATVHRCEECVHSSTGSRSKQLAESRLKSEKK